MINIILIVSFIVSFILTVFLNLSIIRILNGEGIRTSYYITDFHLFKFVRLIRNDKNKKNRKENLLILFATIIFSALTIFLFFHIIL